IGIRLVARLRRRSLEEDVLGLILEIIGTGAPDVSNDGVYHGAIRGRGFHELDPLVLGEAGGQNHVLILEYPTIRNGKRLGQFEDDMWLGNRPSLAELTGRRQVFRIALRRARVYPRDDRIDLSLGQ